MNDQECIQAYETLAGILDQNGLGWVTAQVAEQIRIGKTIQREIETLKEARQAGLFTFDDYPFDDYPSRLKKGPKATFPVTVDYEPPERLRLLIDAIEQAIVITASMEHHLLEYFEKEIQDWQGIQFHADESGSEPRSLDKRKAISRLKSSRNLKELLDALRKEI